MALLVSDNRHEEFSKPPPKKKWLQEYIEKDSQPNLISSNLRTEAAEFVRLFDNQTDEKLNSNLKHLTDAKASPGNMTLSQDVIGGVVQGVLNQFQSFFENECSSGAAASFENKAFPSAPSELKIKKLSKLLDPAKNGAKFNESLKRLSWPGSLDEKASPGDIPEVKEDPKISQNDIAPVVQSVISQFLNGSLADSDFRRSRKRSHKHANCHHKDKSGSSGTSDRMNRSSSVIRYKAKTPEMESPIKVSMPVVHSSDGSVIVPCIKSDHAEEVDENQALNLSLPKPNQKVTFAAEDRCYSIESVKSFQTSKSEELSNLDILARASDDRSKIKIAGEQIHNVQPVSHAENLGIVVKSIKEVNAIASESEQRYYEMPKTYIELTPVIRHTHNAESPISIGQLQGKEEIAFRPSYGNHSPPLLEVPRRSQFASLPSSRQTSPVCFKKSAFPYQGNTSNSPPISALPFPSHNSEHMLAASSHCPILTASPNSYLPSPPVKLSSSPDSHSPSHFRHTSVSPPPLTVLKKAEPTKISPSIFSFPVIKPKPVNPFIENTESKPISTNTYQPKPQPLATYLPPSLPEPPIPNTKPCSSRVSREKVDSHAKDEIKRTSSSTREVHNRLEKNRRAHLKTCFDELANECDLDPKKASNLTVIRSAYKCIMSLRRKERENERNLATLVQEKIRRQNRLEELKREFPGYKSESDCE